MRTKAWWGSFPVTQLFGERPEYYSRYGLAGHNGVDIGMPLGVELVSPLPVTVVEVGDDPAGYGYYVKLRDYSQGDWLFAHLQNEERPQWGAFLEAGWKIGLSGTSGASSGPHLHLAYRPSWEYRLSPYAGWVDPLPFLPREWTQPQ